MTIALFEPLIKPTAAQLNAIGDSQTALNAAYQGAAIEPAVLENAATPEDRYVLRRAFRWLLYSSAGEIVDLSGVNDPVSLSGDDTLFDLDTVEWLATGVFYRVTGCEYAYERMEAPNA